MLEQLMEIIKSNPMMATLYSGGIVAVIVANFRAIVEFIKNRLLYLISFTITKVSRVGYYYEENKNSLDLFLKSQRHIFQKSYELTDKNEFKEGFGLSWYIIFGKLVAVYKELSTERETLVLKIHMRVFFANKDKFTEQLKNALENAMEIYTNKISISFDWNSKRREKRPLSTVYTNDNIGQKIYEDIQSFLHSKDLYIQNNILYKRNYLLYGNPGTGKSSLIFALASELNFKINAIDLKSLRSVSDILQKITDTSKTIYVFEDIDALSTTIKERNMNNKPDDNKRVEMPNNLPDLAPNSRVEGINLSDILNVLDGLYTAEGAICFFTTNHIETLDKAFMRDGRMDYKIELTDLNNQMANKMIEDKLGVKDLFKGTKINPATLQELIIRVIWGNMKLKDFEEKINKK